MRPSQIDLLSDLPRGQNANHLGTAPQSHFEQPENLLETQSLRMNLPDNPESKLFHGVLGGDVVTGDRLPDGRVQRFVLGGSAIGMASDQHHVLLAGSRTGKGRAVIVPNLLMLPETTSIFCLDPKGENARLTARYRAEILNQFVSLLDPFGVSGKSTQKYRVSFNPLNELNPHDKKTFVSKCSLIADSLVVVGDFKEKHWDQTAMQMLRGLIAHVRTYPRYEGVRDLVTVWHLASELASSDPNNPKKYWVEQEMLSNDAAGGIVKNAARDFYDRTGGEFSSVLSNLRKHIDFLGIECMRDCLTGDSITLNDLKRKSLCLYVCLPAMQMNALSGWMRMLVQLTMAAHEEEQEQVGGSTVMILDEFHTLGHLSSLELGAALLAGLGLKFLVVLQDLNQIQSKYPKSWETFLGNSGAIQCFGLSDHTSLEYISKSLGEAPTITRSTNSPSFDQATQQAATGESWSLGLHRLLTSEEVGRFFGRDDKMLRQLILRPGYRPAILSRAFYDKHSLFEGKFNV